MKHISGVRGYVNKVRSVVGGVHGCMISLFSLCLIHGSSVHGILQARMLEWVAMLFSKGSSQTRDWTRISYNFAFAGFLLLLLLFVCLITSPTGCKETHIREEKLDIFGKCLEICLKKDMKTKWHRSALVLVLW